MESARSCHWLLIDYLPNLFGLGRSTPESVEKLFGLPDRAYFRLRRLIDPVTSAMALVVLAPVFAVVALAVLLDVGPPVLFRQIRPGRFMRPFTLYKFRTMRVVYDTTGAVLPDQERTSAPGRFLRRMRLDELPQLYNVLVGNMSLIGPRPLLPRDLPVQIGERASVRPGLTGWAQINGGQKLTIAEKMALDSWYVRHANPAIDARIVWMTAKMMLFGEKINRSEVERAMAVA